MTARVLVVDDVHANVKLLEARLTAEYFDVTTAMSGIEALDICARSSCDIVLLDVMMPGMDGFEVCRRLKSDPATSHIPVVMVTALDQISDRVNGLEAGADDFLTKPVNDIALITRVKSLVRLKMLTDELRVRANTGREFGLDDIALDVNSVPANDGHVLIIDDRAASAERLRKALEEEQHVEIELDPHEAVFRAAEGNFDVVAVSMALSDYDALRLCSQIRSLEKTRNLPILAIIDPEDQPRLLRALDLGINDYLTRPVDRNEMRARVRTQVRKNRYAEQLRNSMQSTVEMAITDPLTGLNNRRYLETHLSSLVQQAKERGKPLSLMVLDIDYFKSINDTYGHDAGDDVLKEFASRIRHGLRGVDLAVRFGGEEFMIVMPDTDIALALMVAERSRQRIERQSFEVSGGSAHLDVTISIGVSRLDGFDDTPEQLIKRADEALYKAKRDGRNRVVSDAA